MFSRLIAITLVASWAASASAQTRDPIYVIRHVHLITMTDDAGDGVKDVVIRGRRIEQIHAAATAKVAGATVIDGSGKYLIPGLIDSHVHIKEEDPLFLFVAAGVTTVQNMAGRPFHLDMRTATNQGTRLGPRIVTTGPTTAQIGVNTLEEVERLVREQHRLGYNAIKMYGSGRDGGMTPALYRRLNEVAREVGMRVVGHAPRNLPFQAVLDERQSSIDHMEEIVYTHRPFARLLQPYIELQFGRASPAVRDSLFRRPVPDLATELRADVDALALAVKHSGLAVTPNLIFFRNIQWMTTDSINALLREKELAYAAPGQRLNWSPMLNNYRNSWSDNKSVISPYLGEVVKLQRAITLAFHKAGVPLMTGTDSEFLGALPGFGVHAELQQFVEAGMSPRDALRAATVAPARIIQIADSVGTIEVGKIADLVLLDANPLDDVRNMRRIAGVLRAGRWLPKAAISAMLDSLSASYAPVQNALTTFMKALEQEGAAAALAVYRASPQRAIIAKPVERVINSYGYRILGQRKNQEAIAIFLLNTEAFPGEYNTWDSLAEAYMNDGQKDLAIRYYQKVLELHPGDENATRMLKQLGR